MINQIRNGFMSYHLITALNIPLIKRLGKLSFQTCNATAIRNNDGLKDERRKDNK